MLRLKQLGILSVGLLLAAAMAVLGVWQLNVYRSQGDDTAAARAAAPALELSVAAPAGQPVRQGYGRSVRFTGHYSAAMQLLVPVDGDAGTFRVLSGLTQADGSVVPVVRGTVTRPTAPAPPTGQVTQTGVLLPSEDDAAAATTGPGQLDAVRLPVLAQQWHGQLVGGFVTLAAADAQAQHLVPATVALPQASGRLRNGAYAFQWWLFGAFTVWMAVRIARDAELGELDPEPSGPADDGPTDGAPTDDAPAGAEPAEEEPAEGQQAGGTAETDRTSAEAGAHSRTT